jgi:hypothetical protein
MSDYDERLHKASVNANNILIQVVTNNEIKLNYGYRLRQEIKTAVDKKERAAGYRAEWLNCAIRDIISCLSVISEQFNKRYPQDRVSSHDFVDILLSSIARIKATAKEREDGKAKKN